MINTKELQQLLAEAGCRVTCQSESIKRWVRYLDHLPRVIRKHNATFGD
jgi:hypothetical protein